ncbi:CPA1 family monovalent cation:H+ antiporter [Pseudomonas duriflava]|uniref:CPA1 family monovalent cation:H+ antiporter n=1 Tax=Pseudomonas duriflava TaxID=459528 RepID=A0A562Q8I2_9PSED|nr:Na+/H+ antiporter [Pseudomonas duriflava]TWI52500.1 CPA1 family monovalent cation:H+ antiporter [Pseudomonas duriflava]
MDTVYLVLILLLVASATGVAARFLPSLPTPLVQVGVGALMAWPASGLHVELEPELFMLLFIAPLLFADARRFPQREFMMLRGPILALALGLVLVTVVGVGYFIHGLFPSIPLPVCFALTAILSPTDAVAVSAISGRLPVPPRLMHILEGESLMNDASGLVALKFAVAAVLTGAFSLMDATFSFFVIAVGGLVVGAALALVFNFIRTRLIERHLGEASTTQIVLLIILLPFAAYLVAEHFHVSGILSAVAAGMVINRTDLKRQDQTSSRIQTRTVWDMLEFTLNALVFLLLGFQLPQIINGALHLSERNGGGWAFMGLLGYVALISLALLTMRFMWILLATRMPRLLRRRTSAPAVSKKVILAGTLAGIRGTVTLAAALSLPELMNDGTPFPARELLIFLATGVILFTLITGSVGLPLVLRNLRLPPDSKAFEEERKARIQGAEAAIRRIERYRQEKAKTLADHAGDEEIIIAFNDVTLQLMDYYHKRLELTDAELSTPVLAARRELERETRLEALKAERGEYYKMRSKHIINDSTLRKLVREVDLLEAALNARIADVAH